MIKTENGEIQRGIIGPEDRGFQPAETPGTARGGNLSTHTRIDQEDSRLGKPGDLGRRRSLRDVRPGKMAKSFRLGGSSVAESAATFPFVLNRTVSKG